MRELEQEEKHALLSLVNEGRTEYEIKKSMEIPLYVVRKELKTLRDLGLIEYKNRGKPKRVISESLRNTITQMTEDNLSNLQMATKLSMSIQTLFKYKQQIRSEGFELKSPKKGRLKQFKTCPHCGKTLY